MLVLGYTSPAVQFVVPPRSFPPWRTGPCRVVGQLALILVALWVQPLSAAPTSQSPAAGPAGEGVARSLPTAESFVPEQSTSRPPAAAAETPSADQQTQASPSSGVTIVDGSVDGVRRYIQARSGLACSYHGHIVQGERAAVACGEGGLLLLGRDAGQWVAKERRPSAGAVVGFLVEGERVLARVVQERIQALEGFTNDATVVQAEPLSGAYEEIELEQLGSGPEEQGPVEVRVVRVEGRDVMVDRGRLDGLEIGSNIAFESNGQTPKVVGRLFGLKQQSARVRIGFGERVFTGAIGYVTQERRTATKNRPLRLANYWELRAGLRPIVHSELTGGGISAALSVGYRWQRIHAFAVLQPLAWGSRSATSVEREFETRDNGSVGFALGYAGASLDLRRFEVGMGIGFQTINDRNGESVPGTGLSFVPLLRVGALDGLHGRLRIGATIFHSEAAFSWAEFSGQFPIVDGMWIKTQFGGTLAGYASGDAGLRMLLSGEGDQGSTFLELSAGGTALFERVCDGAFDCREDNVVGPHVGVDVEFRL